MNATSIKEYREKVCPECRVWFEVRYRNAHGLKYCPFCGEPYDEQSGSAE